MIFLQLVVGGHLLLFLTRTRHAFWRSPYPSWQLFGAIVATSTHSPTTVGVTGVVGEATLSGCRMTPPFESLSMDSEGYD
jgi:hypothetical protein